MILNAYHPISRLNLTEGIIQKLNHAGYWKIGGLRKATRQSLETISMIGETRIQQIKTALKEAGLPSKRL